MIVYHGTTARRARKICTEGFLPRKPSKRVWFAEAKGYAEGRARCQARRTHDRPVVLTCDLNVAEVRRRLGKRRVLHRSGCIAIDGPVPITALRSFPGVVDQPASPEELAAWVNAVLGLKSYKGVHAGHPGILRLAKWVTNRHVTAGRRRWKGIQPEELLSMARQWLPEFFRDVVIDPATVRARRVSRTVEVEVAEEQISPDPREAKAMDLLDDPRADRRARGLKLLAALADPDLFDWCMMCLDDESADVRVAALRTMLRCDEADVEAVEPLARSQDKRARGAAIAAMVHSGGRQRKAWLDRGLRDPEPCVRLEAARQLEHMDPKLDRELFRLALYDPNPQVAELARKLTRHKGYATSWAR